VAKLLCENVRLREERGAWRAQAITDRKEAHYYTVLLETFVELERFTGTCYRSVNWIEVGITKGRGKLEKHNQRVLPLKNIFVYLLQKNFRAILAD